MVKITVLLLQEPYYSSNSKDNYIINYSAFYIVIPTPILQNSLRPRVIAYIRKIP